MKRSSSLKRRVKEIETARSAGAVNVTHVDRSKEGFNLSRNDRLKVLLASFDIARASGNPDARPASSQKAIAIARAIGRAAEVSQNSALWDTVAAIVTEAEQNCTSHAPDSVNDSFSKGGKLNSRLNIGPSE